MGLPWEEERRRHTASVLGDHVIGCHPVFPTFQFLGEECPSGGSVRLLAQPFKHLKIASFIVPPSTLCSSPATLPSTTSVTTHLVKMITPPCSPATCPPPGRSEPPGPVPAPAHSAWHTVPLPQVSDYLVSGACQPRSNQHSRCAWSSLQVTWSTLAARLSTWQQGQQ